MHVNKPDFRPMLTPEMTKVVEYIEDWNEKHPPTADYRQDYIEERVFWNEGGPVPAKVTELKVKGPYGDIPVRLHYPQVTDALLGATVYLHGGSFSLGNNDTHSRVMRIFSEESGTVVIGVDYHLAPEYKFPVQTDEAVAVIRFFHENGAEYGINPNDISISGDSAGGFLTLSSALYLRDHDKDVSYLTSLILYYGAYGMTDSPSYRLLGNEIDCIMRENNTSYYSKGYLKEEDLFNPYYDMFRNDLTHDIPPCFICCGEVDPLVDNSKLLYAILSDKGIPCELKLYPGVLHAFLHYNRMMEDANDALRRGAQYLRAQQKNKA